MSGGRPVSGHLEDELPHAEHHVSGWFTSRLHHHEPAAPAAADPKENDMTTPQPQQRSFLHDVAGILGDLAANTLLDQIAQQSLGRHLTPADTDLVLALIRSLEAPHLAAAAQNEPAPVQQAAAGQPA